MTAPSSAGRGAIASQPPVELYLEVTNRCNLRCKTCPQSWGMSEAPADLSPAQVQRLLEQLPSVRRVVLHGIGEPTLNPELPEIIAVVKAHQAYALFNSNGLLLRGLLREQLVRSGLDELRVSVDAATPETYRRIRGANGFTRIIENVTATARLRDQLASAAPRLSLWMTGLHTNVLELPSLVEVAHAAGIAEVYVQRLVYSGRGLARAQQAILGNLDAPEREALHVAEARARELGVTLRGSGEGLPAVALPDAGAPWRACRRPWSLMYVTANGNILPCCIAPFTAAPYEGLVLGNAFMTPLEEIWNGPRYRDWRARMLDGAPPAACAGCGSAWSL